MDRAGNAQPLSELNHRPDASKRCRAEDKIKCTQSLLDIVLACPWLISTKGAFLPDIHYILSFIF